MKIDVEFLKDLKHCADRYEYLLRHHGEFNGSLSDFLDLPNLDLDYDDKIWVAMRVLTRSQAIKWAMLCAESVVHIFEDKHPNDKSLRDCIEFLKNVNDFDNLINAKALEFKRHMRTAWVDTDFTAACFFESAAIGAADIGTSDQAAIYAARAALAARAANHSTIAATLTAIRAASNSISAAAWQNQEALNLQFLKQVIN